MVWSQVSIKILGVYSDCTQENEKLGIVQYLYYSNYVSFSAWDWGQVGIKLGTKHAVC